MSSTPRTTTVIGCATGVTLAVSLVLAPTSDGSSRASSTTDRHVERTQVRTVEPVSFQLVAAKRAARKRHVAMDWALNQKGKWYRYGATGPNTFDCSGLIQTAYRKAGISIPRTTGGMLSSSRLKRVKRSEARWGDLAFYSAGHVELYSHKNFTFGAHRTGTRIGYRKFSASYQPKWYFRVVGAR